MKKLFLTLSLFYILTDVAGQTNYSKEIKDQIKHVENNLVSRVMIDGKGYNLLDRMAHFKVKGLSIAVVQNYKVIWAKGYGWADEKQKRRVTNTTLFRPGSISKSLNAVAVLKLAQDHRVDLYQDINMYLRSWKFPYDSIAKGKKITLANLLSHTAGLSVYGGFPGYSPGSKIPTLPQVLDGAAPANTPAVRSLSEPGLQFQYSGGGTLISQLIITDIARQPYEKFMYEEVLSPLGMKHSFYAQQPPSGKKLKNIATGYTTEGNEVASLYNVYPEQAAMGLWTTAAELCSYVTEIQLAYQERSAKILNQAMTRLHLTPYIDPSAAMGVFIGERNGGEKYFFHDAGNEGFRGLFYGSVEGGNGIAVCVNSDDGEIIIELLNSVANVYNWKGFDKPVNIITKKISDSLLHEYIGVYLYDGLLAEVTKQQDGLHYWTSGKDVKMYFTSDKDFINIEFSAEKSFIKDNKGHVTGYARKVNAVEYSPAMKVYNVDTLHANKGELNKFGRHLLEGKRFDKAMMYLKRAIELEQGDTSAKINLAHVYLFKKDFDEAIALYKTCMSESSFRDMIKRDFIFFKKNSFDNVLMDKISSKLKL